MNNDIEKIFDLYHLGISKSYDEILDDNKYCGVMRARLQCLCLERGYSFKWLNDNFGLAYKICGMLYLSFFREFLFIDTCTLYKSLEKYCFAKFEPSDDDIIILRSLVFLILSKNMKSLKGVEETIDYVLDCIRNQDVKFARRVFSISMKDNLKYRFNFGIITEHLHEWERFIFNHLFYSSFSFEEEYVEKIYKHVVCLWPLKERWKVVCAIEEYFIYSSKFWEQHKGTEWEDDLKGNITNGMKYLKKLVREDMNRGNDKGLINYEMEKSEVVNEGSSINHNETQIEAKVRSKGRKPESLFKARNGGKDEVKTKAKATDFINHLKEQGLIDTIIDTSRENEVNKAFVLFYKKWINEDNIPSQPNGNACFRFLKEDCALQMASNDVSYMKTYGMFIRKMIVEA